jgi:hypothetical protein
LQDLVAAPNWSTLYIVGLDELIPSLLVEAFRFHGSKIWKRFASTKHFASAFASRERNASVQIYHFLSLPLNKKTDRYKNVILCKSVDVSNGPSISFSHQFIAYDRTDADVSDCHGFVHPLNNEKPTVERKHSIMQRVQYSSIVKKSIFRNLLHPLTMNLALY